MNKVVNIELSGQVFWIEENAYLLLQSYLEKIKQQLAGDECASEISSDIELRIAELFFNYAQGQNKSISLTQLEEIIEQIGYIEGSSQTVEFDDKVPKKSYRDPQNKILGGVCAGLAMRIGVPAFILRLAFLALIGVFGLGIALYLIFWISLDLSIGRGAALAAEGRAATAKQIAEYERPKMNPLVQLQRIIFLPFSLLGMLVSVIGSHFVKRKSAYIFILKNVVALLLIFLTIVFCIGLYEFNYNRLFFWTYSWILSASAMYLVVLVLAIYVSEFYLLKPSLKVKKSLKVGALVPIGIIALALFSLANSHTDYHVETTERQLNASNNRLILKFNDTLPSRKYADRVSYFVKPTGAETNTVSMKIQYNSHGESAQAARENLKQIDYKFEYHDGELVLNRYWTLKDEAVNRGQEVTVTLMIPQGMMLESERPLIVELDDEDEYRYLTSYYKSTPTMYVADGAFFHELGESFSNKLSDNEREVLNAKFCNEYFISEPWGCEYNIRRSVSRNDRFDHAFQNDSDIIEKIRDHLQPDRSLFVSKLVEVNDLIKSISIEYPVKSELQQYVEHLIEVKSADVLATNGR